jgi:hypothetical protein
LALQALALQCVAPTADVRLCNLAQKSICFLADVCHELVDDLFVFEESPLFRFVFLALYPSVQPLAGRVKMQRLTGGALVHLCNDFAAVTLG